MKKGYTVKYVGKDIDEIKEQKGKIVGESTFFGLAYPTKSWQVDFGSDIGIWSVSQDKLDIVSRQFQLSFVF